MGRFSIYLVSEGAVRLPVYVDIQKWEVSFIFYFHGELYVIVPMKMEPIVSSETSAIKSQMPGNYPKRNKLHLQHGESLRTKKNKMIYKICCGVAHEYCGIPPYDGNVIRNYTNMYNRRPLAVTYVA